MASLLNQYVIRIILQLKIFDISEINFQNAKISDSHQSYWSFIVKVFFFSASLARFLNLSAYLYYLPLHVPTTYCDFFLFFNFICLLNYRLSPFSPKMPMNFSSNCLLSRSNQTLDTHNTTAYAKFHAIL